MPLMASVDELFNKCDAAAGRSAIELLCGTLSNDAERVTRLVPAGCVAGAADKSVIHSFVFSLFLMKRPGPTSLLFYS